MATVDQGPRKVSQPLLQVVGLLLRDPTRDDWYGLGIVRELGLGSGTVTQILFRLQQWGWIEDHWEDEAEAHADGRPPRRFYRLTGAGELAARELMRERQARIARLQLRGTTA
jgi:PadR family transcriptional regulator PadR